MGEEALLGLHTYLIDEENTSTFESRNVPQLEQMVDAISDKDLTRIVSNPLRSLQILVHGAVTDEDETAALTHLEDQVAGDSEVSIAQSASLPKFNQQDLDQIVEITQMDEDIAKDVYRSSNYNKAAAIHSLMSMAS